MHFARFALAVSLVAGTALADITSTPESGWIPEYQQLVLKGGYQYYRTNANFDTNGQLVDPTVGGQSVTLMDNRFRLAGEYGVAQDWAVSFKAGFTQTSADTAAANVGSGSGLSDIEAGIKWNVKVMDPILTLELFTRIPAASTDVARGDVVVTDGAVDVGGRLYTGHRAGKMLFSLAPGFVYRSKSYSAQFTLDGLVRFDFLKGYVQGIGSFVYSFDDTSKPFYSDPNKPDAPGAAGSFARLNGAPLGFVLGAGLGFKVYEEWMVEGQIQHTIWGQRYPSYLGAYIGIRTMFDFFKPIKPKRVKDVPFEEDDAKS